MKKNLIVYLCLLAYGIAPLKSLAQETKNYKLSLKEAVDFAIKNSRSVKNASLSIQAANEQKWETTAIGLPQLTGKVEYLNGVIQQFPGIDFNGDGIVDIGAKHSLTPSVTLSQILFDGSYLVGLQSAKVFLEISKNIKIKTKNQIEVETIKAYANALLIEESLKITEQNKIALVDNLTETKQVFENGLIEEEGVEQLELTLASIENNLSRLTQLKQVTHNVLKIIFSIDSKHTLELTDNLETIYKNHSNIDADKVTKSYFDNIDIKISENNVKAKGLLFKLEKAKLLPSVVSFLNANYIGNNNEFTSLFGSDQKYVNTLNLGVTVRVPIFSSFGNRSKIRRAKINKNIAENELKTTKATIGVEVDNAKTELEFARLNYNNNKKLLALATKIEKKNRFKFKEGISSSFDLRQSQVQLYTAQQEYLQSIVEIINKKAALQNLYK